MYAVKLLQDYSGAKAGEAIELNSDEDCQRLIDSGIAEPVDKKANDAAEQERIAQSVYAQMKSDLKSPGLKFFAQPNNGGAVGPYNNFGEFAKAVMAPDQQLANFMQEQKSTGMSEAISADGGFLIPSEWSGALLEAINEESVIASRCRNFPVNNNLSLPFLNRGSQALSSTGGMRVYKPAEGVAKTASQPALGKADLRLHKMAIVVYATDELLRDSSIALQTFLTTLASTEFARTKDEDVINGSGAGECLGVLNAPCVISQAKQTAQAACTIVTENVVNMFSRLYPRSIKNAVWLANSDCLPELMKLSINVGTGGSAIGLLKTSTVGISGAPSTTILGRPLLLVEPCQTVGTVGDIILADFSQYITITKAGEGMDVATSIHLKFLEDETAFRFVIRFDGQPWWAQAITPKHSAVTQSPFVSLAVRA